MMAGMDIDSIDELPDAGREFNARLERIDERLAAVERRLERLEDVGEEPTSKEEKFAAILAFAENKFLVPIRQLQPEFSLVLAVIVLSLFDRLCLVIVSTPVWIVIRLVSHGVRRTNISNAFRLVTVHSSPFRSVDRPCR
jgi:hypothetical protein